MTFVDDKKDIPRRADVYVDMETLSWKVARWATLPISSLREILISVGHNPENAKTCLKPDALYFLVDAYVYNRKLWGNKADLLLKNPNQEFLVEKKEREGILVKVEPCK